MTASEAALARLATTARSIDTAEQRAGYFFLALGLLGSSAPDVLTFILDRADELSEVGA